MSRFAFAAAILACAASAAAETAYLAAIEDVPLPPGFAELDSGWALQAETGRLVEARAAGEGGAELARAFYRETLPALGWSLSPQPEALVFVRGRERLTITVSEPTSRRAVVRVRLLVASPPQGD